MILKDLLALIGFKKIQQICLIKILFLTGSLEFIKPEEITAEKHTITIDNNHVLSSKLDADLNWTNTQQISDENAELILNKLHFNSKLEAFEWLDSLMQRKFFNSYKEKFNSKNIIPDNPILIKLIENFNLDNELTLQGKFDSIIVLGSSKNNFKNRIDFLATQLNNKNLSTSEILLLASNLPASPYLDDEVELILAEKLSLQNKKSVQENFENIEKLFIEIASHHLKSLNIKIPVTLKEIKKTFQENYSLYYKSKLISSLRDSALLKNVTWPNENDICKKLIPETLEKYNPQIINTYSKKLGNKIVRPNTYENAKAWFKTQKSFISENPKAKILIVSTQPYAKYQLKAFKSIVKDQFNVDVIALKGHNINSSMLLKEIAAEIHASKYLILNK